MSHNSQVSPPFLVCSFPCLCFLSSKSGCDAVAQACYACATKSRLSPLGLIHIVRNDAGGIAVIGRRDPAAIEIVSRRVGTEAAIPSKRQKLRASRGTHTALGARAPGSECTCSAVYSQEGA